MFFYVWVALEATWNVSLFSFCYKFMPLTRWVNASRAKSMRDRLPAYARNLLVNRYNRPPGGPGSKKGTLGQRRWAIATWQWFVLNKVGAVVTIPGKLALALWITGETDGELPDWVPSVIRGHAQRDDAQLSDAAAAAAAAVVAVEDRVKGGGER